MPYRIDPNTGQPVWDGTSIPQASRDSLAAQIRSLQDQIDNLSFIDLDDVPATYTGQSGKIISVKSTEDGLEFITNTGGGGVTDGDKGDITVAGSGATWTIDASAVTEAKIADGAVTANKIGTGAVGPTQLASTAVTAGSYTLANITVDADGRITAASNGTAGNGTVTTVSVATANGVSGTVANATTTPAITLSLGSITPSSVNGITLSGSATPTLAVTGTTAVSGTNTGDQTITLTGDVTGSGTGSFAATIAGNAVTNAKLAEVAPSTFKGNPTTGTTQSPVDMTPAEAAAILPVFTSSVKGLAPSSGGGTANFLRADATFAQAVVTGSIANAIIRANGTGGATTQGSSILVNDADATSFSFPNVQMAASFTGQTNASFVITPQGNGALVFGPRPDNGITGGAARGSGSIDFQTLRNASNQVATGARSAILCGQQNVANGTEGAILCGSTNTISNFYSSVISGQSNTASGGAAVCMGTSNQATAINAVAMGSYSRANRIGYRVSASGLGSGPGSGLGTAQGGVLTMRGSTTTATQGELTLDAATPTASNRITLLDNQTMFADIFVVARSINGADDACFVRRCLVTRDTGVGTITLVGSNTPTADIKTAGASGWLVDLAVELTGGSLQVLVTGAASTSITWFADVSIREVIRAST